MQRRKLRETRKLNAMLKAEEVRNEAVLGQLKRALGSGSGDGDVAAEGGTTASPFAFLTSSPHADARGKPLTQNVEYALAQLPALRTLLSELRSSAHRDAVTRGGATRRARGDDEDEDDQGVDAKRRRYLDAQSRRALQRKGVEASDAAGMGAQAGAAGRKVGREEVEGMEAVVKALGVEMDGKQEER